MSDVKEIEVEQVNPVAVGTKKVIRSPRSLKMVNDRASHFYFKRTLAILRSIGKYRS
jgi:hypothetical protein